MSCSYARMKESCWLLLRKIEVALAGRSPLRLTMFCYLRTVRSWPLLTDIRSWELPPVGICPGSRALAACLRSTPPRVLFETLHRLAVDIDSRHWAIRIITSLLCAPQHLLASQMLAA